MNIPRIQIFEEQINTDLFNAAVALALSTTENAKQVSPVKNSLCRVPWYGKIDFQRYLEASGIRYLGELLERYGEHFDDDLRSLRALAIAVAWIDPVFTASMSVGSQREDFMEKLQKNKDDACIAASLTMLAPQDEREALRQQFLDRRYENIAEMICVLCSLYDCSDAFPALRPQLIRLLGKERALPVEGNIGVFSWLICNYRGEILSCRKKDNGLLRALVRLNDSYVREKDAAYKLLMDSGYTHGEILTLNSMLVWERHSGSKHLYADSIPAEKLATAYVVHNLNSKEPPSAVALDYILQLLAAYRNFDIRYEGYANLWAAVSEQLDIQCPQIMLWMIRDASLDYEYTFDVLDPKWDLLAQQLQEDAYRELFHDQLLAARTQPAGHVRQMLAHYQELTGKDYLDRLNSYSYKELNVFCMLVDLGIVDLREHFEKHREDEADKRSHTANQYVWEYTRSISTQHAFDFWKAFFSEHSPRDVPTFWPGQLFHEGFLRSKGSYESYRPFSHIRYLQPGLSRDENRMVLDWIDRSVFETATSQYAHFALAFLRSEDTGKLYEPHELQPIYTALRELDPDNAAVKELRYRFLSKEELEQERIAAEAARDAEKRRIWEKNLEEKRAILRERYDGSYCSLVELLNSLHTWNDHKKQGAICVAERLPEFLRAHPRVNICEYGYLLDLCAQLIGFQLMDGQAVRQALNSVTIIEEANIAC